MRLLVLGAGGFIGTHIVREAVDRRSFTEIFATGNFTDQNQSCVEQISLDWQKPESLIGPITQIAPDYVVNCSGKTTGSEAELMKANFLLGGAVYAALSIVAEKKPVCLVNLGSASEYGISGERRITEADGCNPASDYGLSKLLLADLCFRQERKVDRLRMLHVRAFNLIGAGMPPNLLFGKIFSHVKSESKEPIPLGGLSGVRDFLDCAEFARSVLRLAFQDCAEGIFNVCSGQGTCVRTLVELIKSELAGRFDYTENSSLTFRTGDDMVIGDPGKFANATGELPVSDPLSEISRLCEEFDHER